MLCTIYTHIAYTYTRCLMCVSLQTCELVGKLNKDKQQVPSTVVSAKATDTFESLLGRSQKSSAVKTVEKWTISSSTKWILM